MCIAGEGCNLCDFIFRTVDTPSNSAGRDTQIDRVGSALVLKHNGKRILRLCSGLGEYLRSYTIICNTGLLKFIYQSPRLHSTNKFRSAFQSWLQSKVLCVLHYFEHGFNGVTNIDARILNATRCSLQTFSTWVVQMFRTII